MDLLSSVILIPFFVLAIFFTVGTWTGLRVVTSAQGRWIPRDRSLWTSFVLSGVVCWATLIMLISKLL